MGQAKSFVTASQVLYRLAEIEKNGVEFYQGLLEGTRSSWIRKFATMMVRAESRHHARFLEYAQRAEQSLVEEDDLLFAPIPPETRRLLATLVFAPKERVKQSAPYATEEEALRVALRAEESLALLLIQLREYVPKSQRRYVDRVIKEERSHKAFLEELLLKKRYKADLAPS